MHLKTLNLIGSMEELAALPSGKVVINTINTYSFVTAKKDRDFARALESGDALLPDGMGIVWGCRMARANSRPSRRITGWDLFEFEMERLNSRGGKCFFMGSSPRILNLIKEKAAVTYPDIEIDTYSPPYKDSFDEADNQAIAAAVNASAPDLLWIGMSAPKQEKWVLENVARLDIDCHIGSIGAVFSFFAGTERRAPLAWQRSGFEWLYRFIHDPRRLWRRYILGNLRFAAYLMGEMVTSGRKSAGNTRNQSSIKS